MTTPQFITNDTYAGLIARPVLATHCTTGLIETSHLQPIAMSNGKAKYEPLETGDGSDNEANGYSQAAAAQLAAARKLERRARIMLYASIGLVVIAACLLFGLPVLRRTPSELECAQVVSPYCRFFC